MWRRARSLFHPSRVVHLEDVYSQADQARNFGIWTAAPRQPVRPLAEAAPHILAQGERRDTVLWPALFEAFPNWRWGMQPTGDCTRWMQQHLGDVLGANLWAAGKIRKPDALVAGESIYALAKCELVNSYGYHGAGATGAAVANACVKFGQLYRLRYEAKGEVCDLQEETDYSIAWGNYGKGLPDWLEPYAAQHKGTDRRSIRTIEEMGLLIQAGYPCQYCGYTAWGRNRDSDGIATKFDHGWHAIAATGVRWNRDGSVLAIWIANTGHGDHVEGPVGPYTMPEPYAACGSWVPAKEITPVIDAGDCYTTSGIDGWPVLDLPDWGAGAYL